MESKFSALTTDPRPAQPYDPGPRVVFESISAGTPCILSDLVCVHTGSKEYSFFYEHQNENDFNRMIQDIKKTDLNVLSKNSFEYAFKEYTVENACKIAYQDIMNYKNGAKK